MLRIEMRDMFYGFIRNYAGLGLRAGVSDANWTHEILGFYSRLGQMLGCYVQYEWKRFDLVWFWDLAAMTYEKPLLHIEHENRPNRLDHLISKVRESMSENILIIAYPDSKSELDRFLEALTSLLKGMKGSVELLAILDPIFIRDDKHSITGYIIKGGKGLVGKLSARRKTTEDEISYAEPVLEER